MEVELSVLKQVNQELPAPLTSICNFYSSSTCFQFAAKVENHVRVALLKS